MRWSYVVLILAGIAGALGIGWFFDSQKVISTQNPLQVPDNIDYYLSGVRYQSFNDQGFTRFQMRTPYLEHFIREDTSQLTQPMLDYFNDSEQWQLSATRGSLQHGTEIFQLQQQARVSRIDALDPFVLHSELIVFKADTELLEVPQSLQISSRDLQLEADSALMDIKNSRHEFFNVNATYDSNKHEPG